MYGNSLASSKDINLLYPSSSFKHSEVEEELQKHREVMDSNLNSHQQHQQQQQLNSRLMRYRSAPSSLLANFVDNGGEGERCEDFLHPRSSSPEAESMFARFMSCGGGGGGDAAPTDLCEIEVKTTLAAAVNQRNSQFMPSLEHEAEVISRQNGYSTASQMIYQTRPPPPPLPNHSSAAMENSYRVVNSIAMEHHHPQVKSASRNSPNLIRHSSSPAGLFSHLTVENGYGIMMGMGNFRGRNGTNGEVAPSSSRLKGQRNFSSPGPPSSSGLMSQISEIESDSIGTTSPDDGSLANSNDGSRCFIPGFPIGSWDDSALVSENFTGLKRLGNANGKIISGLNQSETQNGETGNHTPLTHHFSLPKTSAEMATMEKFLQFQDSVPCKIRAKRGCATHPRSIAERVRRTRISERMRKLQELVPNMDKQTNTADMLDLAVDYIKDLQKQVKTLSDLRASCTCSSKQKTYSNPTV